LGYFTSVIISKQLANFLTDANFVYKACKLHWKLPQGLDCR
jgi:hypothetical protein